MYDSVVFSETISVHNRIMNTNLLSQIAMLGQKWFLQNHLSSQRRANVAIWWLKCFLQGHLSGQIPYFELKL